MMNQLRHTWLAVLALALLGSQAGASIYYINVPLSQGSAGGFGYSWLHDADGSGTGRNANGNKVALGDGANSLLGVLDTNLNALTLSNPATSPDPLMHSALGVVNANSLRLLGGVLSVENGVYGGGYIDYTYETGAGPNPTVVSGTFYFNDRDEMNAGSADGTKPNSGNVASGVLDFAEWGNNWMYGNFTTAAQLDAEWGFLADLPNSRFTSADFDHIDDWDKAAATGTRLGIDIRGTDYIPEPMSLLVWGGIVAVTALRRRASMA